VIREAGYDGEYGVIRLFEEGELDRLTKGELLFHAPTRRRTRTAGPEAGKPAEVETAPSSAPPTPLPGENTPSAAAASWQGSTPIRPAPP
jgi:hypothetical protein